MSCNNLGPHLPRAHSPLAQHITARTWCRRGLKTQIAMATLPSTDSAPNPNPVEDIKTVNVRIKGTVQGVFYRNWTVETARKLGLDGWVRNRRDGSVEAVFAGKPSVVDNMVESCKLGPPAAVVTGVNVQPIKQAISPGFEKRPTE
ncbi:hypothetical protein GOP47_0029924 [Adiantum capillus-veneris]|nr:hypothetical protein GOP47_0029924 [Adiantum capillus-veneris]